MLDLNDVRLFVQAADHGGFAAASRALGIPKSTLSKRVAALESELGAALVERSSRRFVLTDVGRDFHDHATAMLIEAESAEASVRGRLAEPTGVVRLTCSLPTAQWTLAPHLAALALAHPKVQLAVHASDRFVDLVQEGFDLAIRSHRDPLPDSALVQRALGADPIVLVAAPAYLAARGVPREPAELAAHDGVPLSPRVPGWRLERGDVRVHVEPRARAYADEVTVLLAAARGGLGIAALPHRFCRADVALGALVDVLPGWTAGRVCTTLLMPERRARLPAVRVLADALVALLRG